MISFPHVWKIQKSQETLLHSVTYCHPNPLTLKPDTWVVKFLVPRKRSERGEGRARETELPPVPEEGPCKDKDGGLELKVWLKR